MHRNFAGLCASSICWMWARARESSVSIRQCQPLIARHHLSLQRSEWGFPWHLSAHSFILLPLFGTLLAQYARLSVPRCTTPTLPSYIWYLRLKQRSRTRSAYRFHPQFCAILKADTSDIYSVGISGHQHWIIFLQMLPAPPRTRCT